MTPPSSVCVAVVLLVHVIQVIHKQSERKTTASLHTVVPFGIAVCLSILFIFLTHIEFSFEFFFEERSLEPRMNLRCGHRVGPVDDERKRKIIYDDYFFF